MKSNESGSRTIQFERKSLQSEDGTFAAVDAIVQDLMQRRNQFKEEFCKAYLADTGLGPSDVVLCQQLRQEEDGGFVDRFWFEPKSKIFQSFDEKSPLYTGPKPT